MIEGFSDRDSTMPDFLLRRECLFLSKSPRTERRYIFFGICTRVDRKCQDGWNVTLIITLRGQTRWFYTWYIKHLIRRVHTRAHSVPSIRERHRKRLYRKI